MIIIEIHLCDVDHMVDSYQFGDYEKYGNSSNYIQTSRTMGAQPERKKNDSKAYRCKGSE